MTNHMKPPKGGRRRGEMPRPQGPTITALQMLYEREKYHAGMWKPGQVKTPEDMEVNPAFLEQIEIIKSFAEVDVKSGILDKYRSVYGGHQSYDECMQVSADNNAMILLEALNYTTLYSDLDDPYDKGWLKILEIIVSLYCGNPYTRDRIGYLMWCIAKHISPSCYFPLGLDLNYDPRNWHRPGQNPKPGIGIPPTFTFDGSNQVFGPEDDIWNCELPDTRPGE